MRNNGLNENFIEGIAVNDSLAEKERAKVKSNLFFLFWIFIALALMLTVIVLNTYVFFITDVQGPSMENTLYTNDKLVANRIKQPSIGDIIVLRHDNKLIIKRVIAFEGSTVELKNGYVYVDGQKVDEPYVKKQGVTYQDKTNKITKWELTENQIFYLGDNREVSADARGNGPCETSDVVGVIEGWSLWFKKLF